MEVCWCHFSAQNPSVALIKIKLFSKDVYNLAQPISLASLLQNHSPGHASLQRATLGTITHAVPYAYDT